MRIRTIVFVFIICFMINLPNALSGEEVLAVFNVENRGTNLTTESLDNIAELLFTLMTAHGYQVAPRSEVKERLAKYKAESHKLCYDQSCQIEIGRDLAAQKTLKTQLLKLGSKCKVTITMYDLKKSASESGAVHTGACDEDSIVKSTEKAVEKLFGDKSTGTEERDNSQATKIRSWEVNQKGFDRYWVRCPYGRKWKEPKCVGKNLGKKWEKAFEACPKGYRLPTLDEFKSLSKESTLESCNEDPACVCVFLTGKYIYWTSSRSGDSGKAKAIKFQRKWGGKFIVIDERKDSVLNVTCVRGE